MAMSTQAVAGPVPVVARDINTSFIKALQRAIRLLFYPLPIPVGWQSGR